jgi:hypothetical protein
VFHTLAETGDGQRNKRGSSGRNMLVLCRKGSQTEYARPGMHHW